MNFVNTEGPTTYLAAGTTSASITTAAPVIDNRRNRSITISAVFSASGSPVGISRILVSNDGTNWATYSAQDQAVAASSVCVHTIEDRVAFVRWTYVYTSGGGASGVDVTYTTANY